MNLIKEVTEFPTIREQENAEVLRLKDLAEARMLEMMAHDDLPLIESQRYGQAYYFWCRAYVAFVGRYGVVPK